MAVLSLDVYKYLLDVLPLARTNSQDLRNEPVLALCERIIWAGGVSNISFSDSLLEKAAQFYTQEKILGIARAYFNDTLINTTVAQELERKIFCLKKGIPSLPSTKAQLILKGFGHDLSEEQVLAVYGSYGLSQSFKNLRDEFDFMDINRRVQKLNLLLQQKNKQEIERIHELYISIRAYLLADKSNKKSVIRNAPLSRSTFFKYWKSFCSYGFLGLIDKDVGNYFRESKMGFANEGLIVIDKVQNAKNTETHYIKQMQYKGINVKRSVINKIFQKWDVQNFKSAFKNNLERLEKPFEEEKVPQVTIKPFSDKFVDRNFILFLERVSKYGLLVDAPGLFVLWYYIERFGFLDILEDLDLTHAENGYSWLDYFLLNVGRIFYGISSYSRTCVREEPSLIFFSHLVALPCNDSFLNGISKITEDQLFTFQKWMIGRIKTLGFVKGKKLAFDFHQIDLDVDMGKLKKITKGPSPKKKLCVNGFRPHIAWDLETGNLVVAEFRKGDARGTKTIKRFIKDFLLNPFKGLFETVYIDSEYTGKAVWSFVVDSTDGMNADLVACIKMNLFVKKGATEFLLKEEGDDGFWSYWDKNHVYSSKTFILAWDHEEKNTGEIKHFKLNCLLKKNQKTGKFRCFGTTKLHYTSREILKDYSHRWIIENGIKDLVHSFYLDQCPGIDPHNVNVHFLMVSICKHLYSMIQADCQELFENYNGTSKTLKTMREVLIRQGCGRINIVGNEIVVKFVNSFSLDMTNALRPLYEKINEECHDGLKILGGYRLRFELKTPYGEERRNLKKKVSLSSEKPINNSPHMDSS